MQGTYRILTQEWVARAGLMRNPQPNAPALWMPYSEVVDCEVAADRAKSHGARIFVTPTDIREAGRFAVRLDPIAAAIGINRGLR